MIRDERRDVIQTHFPPADGVMRQGLLSVSAGPGFLECVGTRQSTCEPHVRERVHVSELLRL